MTPWKFITNHAQVLCLAARQPRITARDLSAAIGITEKSARNIIADLEAEGYLTKTREGRRVRYQVNADMPLRHETQQDKAVGAVLKVLGWKGRHARGPISS